jgi:hypothetical protein
VLFWGCGGLAEDGERPFSNSALGDDRDARWAATPEAALEAARARAGAGGTEGHASRAPALARASRVGEPCGQSGDEPERSIIIVGDVALQDDAHCEAASACLMRAHEGRTCPASVAGSAAECAAADGAAFVPVPPPLVPESAWQGGVCTCRCAGSDPGADYCACPAEMLCRALIPSAGVNAAARSHVGSYCAY